MRIVLLPVVCVLYCAAQVFSKATDAKCTPRLLVVSYDAFRDDYLDRNITPHAIEFRKHGVYAHRLNNVFPTKTFTNHFSIATGVYPESHGVTANQLYDSKLGNISYSSALFKYNPEIMPIWTFNELSGRISGCMMWPGFSFEYHNVNCTYGVNFDPGMPLKDRVDTIMGWLTNKEKPANLVVMYVEQPDKIGHQIGPNDPKMNEYIQKVDEITGYIQEQLKMNNLSECTDVIHLSDHGMVSVNASNFLDFSPFLINGTYKTYGTSPVLQVVPINESLIGDIYERLLNASKKLKHFQVYKQPDMPERWHVKTPRFGPIVVVADLNFAFQDMFNSVNYYKQKYNITPSPSTQYGIHGYDNQLPEMAGYFMAKGPSFKQGVVVEEYNVIDLYNLFVKILDLQNPPSTNGSYDKPKVLLIDTTPKVPLTGIIIGAVLIILVMIVASIFFMYRRKQSYFMWW